MKQTIVAGLSIMALIASAIAAEAPSFAGEYADRNFLNGRAVFQMSLEQSGTNLSVWFSTGYNDGHGCSVDAQGTGKSAGKGRSSSRFRTARATPAAARLHAPAMPSPSH